MKDEITSQISKITIKLIAIFCLYLLFHGKVAPGGAFQAGALAAIALIFYKLLHDKNNLININLCYYLAISGSFICSLVLIIPVFMNGYFMEYGQLHSNKYTAQTAGIMLFEIGIFLVVGAILTLIFLYFNQENNNDS
jgi:multicomponent Na+:H+ antiporter subunit B